MVEPTHLKKYESNWLHLPQFSGVKSPKILELPPPNLTNVGGTHGTFFPKNSTLEPSHGTLSTHLLTVVN